MGKEEKLRPVLKWLRLTQRPRNTYRKRNGCLRNLIAVEYLVYKGEVEPLITRNKLSACRVGVCSWIKPSNRTSDLAYRYIARVLFKYKGFKASLSKSADLTSERKGISRLVSALIRLLSAQNHRGKTHRVCDHFQRWPSQSCHFCYVC